VKRILVVAWVCLSGCGGGDGASIAIEDLGARAIDAACEYEVRCGGAPDRAGCDESVYTRQQLVVDVKAGKIIYDGKAAAACLDLYRVTSCKVSDGAFSLLNQSQSCRNAIKGAVATGGACLTSEECQSQACDKSACTTATECCAGTCAAKISAGGDCSSSAVGCADDLFCKQGDTATTWTCAPFIADGQPCTSVDHCVAGRRCNLVMGTTKGTCGVLPARGQACPGTACDSSADFCDPASKTCLGRIPVGGDCTGLATGCVPYANCDTATMKCIARKRGGEACTESSDCLMGVACTGGVCVPPLDEPACT